MIELRLSGHVATAILTSCMDKELFSAIASENYRYVCIYFSFAHEVKLVCMTVLIASIADLFAINISDRSRRLQ